MGTVGIPVKLLHEALGHTVTIELKGGATYRGRLFDGMWRSCVKITTSLTRRSGRQLQYFDEGHRSHCARRKTNTLG